MITEPNGQPIPELSLRQTSPDGFSIKSMAEIEEQSSGRKESPHRHNYFTVLWIRRASGMHHIDFSSYPVEEGSVFCIAPSQIHLLQVDPEPDGTVLLFDAAFLAHTGLNAGFLIEEGLFHDFEHRPLRVDDTFNRAMLPLTGQLFAEFAGASPFRLESIGGYLKVFLLACLRLHKAQRATTGGAENRAQSIVCGFRNLIDSHYRDKHKVNEYAEALHLTPGHLNDVIRRHTGRSAKELIQQRLLLEAQRSALHTDCTLQEITYHLGFKDPAHFSKFFKKHNGLSFMDYRKKVRGPYEGRT